MTIVVSRKYAQAQPSGENPSPRKRRSIKDVSLAIEVSQDEIIEMPQLDLANLILEQTILLQEVLAKKKRQEEIKRELKKKKVLYNVKDILLILLTYQILMNILQSLTR